ncbi:MAG TPA: YdcF family protein [Candidatus Polarisedimenticolia bacterium]|jgi:uncharacterized SAM-binding protein YcdF (DUF218 family)
MGRISRRSLAAACAGLGTAGLLLLLFEWPGLRGATAWLCAGEPPVASDLLVVLAGGSGERLATALEVYRAGLAPAILITDGFGFADKDMRYLNERGVPARSLMAPLRPATSTYEDALTIRQVVLRENLKSILVVTSPYHCRRARLILKRVVGSLGVRITVTPSVTLYMDLGHWWRSRQGWITVPGEFPKLLWAWVTVPTVPAVGDAGLRK